ncbi:MAG: UDP-N-acetylmuramoyl-L-alanyl-D-glutamate--2,6-diaminopimelate ligase [bacterium]|nr:UDP-N-acetylmuramoyl-L-alanyl-D-glutamate--2,6-diaminopimelate ligase [bacterium]
MRLQELIAEPPGVRLPEGENPEITGLATDSRKVQPGDLFVAIRGGQEVDRHPYVPQALAAGAVAAVVEVPVEAGTAVQVQVPSTRRALAEMARRFYGKPDEALRMVGVTGTNGKTTTAYLIHAVLEAAGWKPGLIGTVEYRVGTQRRPAENSTPEAHDLHRMLREMVGEGCQAAVMEATSHGLALDRVHGIGYEAAVFTNLTRDHLDFHGTPEAYLAAKALLFDNLGKDAQAVVNVDDPVAQRLLAHCKARVVSYGTSDTAQVRIRNGHTSWQGSTLHLETPAGDLDLEMALQGRFNFWNGAAAVAVGLAMEIDPGVIAEAVREVRVPGRFEAVDRGQDFGIVVDYSHTPDSLENALEAARELTKNRLICVFGCGGDRDRGKRPEMGRVSARLADVSVVTSDNPRTEDPEAIVQDILPGLGETTCKVEIDRRAAIEWAVQHAGAGDLVLIAGKGHEDYQIIGREKSHFDDREVAAEAVERRKK